MKDISALIEKAVPETVALRHELHQHPELAYHESETARRVLDRINHLPGLKIQTGLAGGTGIVATLNSGKPGKCVALRAELDALPVNEETGKPYASKTPGKMHACGHDGHTSCVVGAAMVLSQIAADLPGCVKFIWQPAEESGGGGQKMVADGVLESPKVDGIFALHGWPSLPVGTIGVRPGPVLAATNPWTMTIHGKGAHAAYPHKGIDPIVIASHIVLAWQTIVSRGTSPTDSCVVTVGKFNAGTAENIIPPSATLGGTIRTLTPETRARAVAEVRRIAERTADAFGARAEIEIRDGYPAMINNDAAAAFVDTVAREVLGDAHVENAEPPSLGGEDFAYYAQRVPAAFWRLGVRDPKQSEMPGLHHPHYDFNDAALPIGVKLHCEIARRFLQGA